MADWDGLECRDALRLVGSNPTPSAKNSFVLITKNLLENEDFDF